MIRFVCSCLLVACSTSPAIGVDAAARPDVATGAVSAWQNGPALPTPRANHCAVAIDDWVLVIGGNYMATGGFVKTDEIHAAQLATDGTLGPWQLAGHTPSPVSECNATSDGRHLYVVDGLYDRMTDAGQIWTADLDATGHLPTLTSRGALPAGVVTIATGATVHDGTLLVMDQVLPTSGDTVVTLRTPLAGLAWATDDWKIGFHSQSEYAFTGAFAYSLGGYHDPAVGAVPDVFVAPIGAGGAVGAPAATTPLPTAVGFGKATAVDNWLFVVGGRVQVFGAPGTPVVYAAPLAADGTVGAWTTATPLPVPRTNHALVVTGDFLVVTGGAANGPGDTTVLIARVRYAPS